MLCLMLTILFTLSLTLPLTPTLTLTPHQATYIVILPIMLCLMLTIPDCRRAKCKVC